MAKRDDVLNIDQLAEMFGLTTWEDLDECNLDYYLDCADSATKDEEYTTEADKEEAFYAAQDRARDELFAQWYSAVARTAETFLEKAMGLSLHGIKVKGKLPDHPYELRIKPLTSWNDSARKLVILINGVGEFHFTSLKEFLNSGPYTARAACLDHLGYANMYSRIYGTTSASQYYDRAMP